MIKHAENNSSNQRFNKENAYFIFKYLILVGCVGGFTYQIAQFIRHFYDYPVVVGIEIIEPDYFVQPAMTICNTNPIKRSVFCERYPWQCKRPRNMKKFCSQRPHYCYEHSRSYMSNISIPLDPGFKKVDDEGKRKIIDELFDVDPGTFVYLTGSLRDDGFKGPFFINSLLPCYALNSRAFSDEDPLEGEFFKHLRKSRMDRYTFVSGSSIYMNESEYYDYNAKPAVLLAVHSPFEVVDPNFDGVLIEPGKKYTIHVRLEENHLLPYPYKTDCRDYELQWEENNGAGPRSQQVCVNKCWQDYYQACYNCTNVIMKSRPQAECIPFVQAYCDIEEEGAVLKFCLSQCKIECKQRKYIYRVQEKPYDSNYWDRWQGRITSVDIVIDEPQIVVFSHKPQYLAIELFSYIGGFLGCWLGYSIWTSLLAFFKYSKKLFTRANKIMGKTGIYELKRNITSL